MRRHFKKLHLALGGGVVLLSLAVASPAQADEAVTDTSTAVSQPLDGQTLVTTQIDGQTVTSLPDTNATSLLSDTPVVQPQPSEPSLSPTPDSSLPSDPNLTASQQSSSAPTSTVPSETQSPPPDLPTVTSVETKIESATVTLTTAVNAASPEAISSASTQVEAANTAISEASSALETATALTSTADSATALIAPAQASVESATAAVDTATALVDSQTALVATDTTNVANAQTALDNAIALPPSAMPYTTAGYVAPVAPENPTVTTTVLPAMYDAATQIQTPFDVKMGDTVFNGQGTTSQIYVSSKATISFGGPDWTFWDWPNQTQDGIYVFQSDYMSAGTGASVTVTTTETTLSVDWVLHRFGDSNGPLTNISWDMTVNPETGEWTGVGTMSGNTTGLYGGPRTGVRQDNVLTQVPVLDNTQKTALIATATQNLTTAQETLTTDTQNLTTLQENLTTATTNLTTAQENLTAVTTSATEATAAATAAVATADQLADSAVQAVAVAVAAVQAYVPPAPPAPEPQPQQPSEPTPVVVPDPAPPVPEVVQPEVPQNPEPTTDPQPDEPVQPTDPTEPETPEPPVIDPVDPSPTPDPVVDPTPTEPEQPQDPTPEPVVEPTPEPAPEPTVEPSPDPSPEPPTVPGLEPNSPDQLPDTTPKLPDPELLVPRVQVDKPGVENGGIEFFGTKTQPQVIGEDGKLTPPPPPPGSGLPLDPEAITIADTFIGQPGGTTFNAPDVAVPVELTYVCTTVSKDDGTEVHIDLDGNEHPIEQCTFLPAGLDVIPGAGEAIQAVGAAYAALANIGNDMSPVTRKKAKKILVATIVVAAFRRRFGE